MLTLKKIADTVCVATGLDIRIKRRDHQRCFARMIYYKVARDNTYESSYRIGDEVNHDHATVMFWLKKFDSDVKLGQNASLYRHVLRELGLDIKTKENFGTKTSELLRLTILESLKDFNYSQLSEFNKTRLEPFKKLRGIL